MFSCVIFNLSYRIPQNLIVRTIAFKNNMYKNNENFEAYDPAIAKAKIENPESIFSV